MSKYHLTRFSKGFIEMMAKEKVAEPKKVRDYDILKAKESGSSLNQIAIKFGLSKNTVCEILREYRKE